MRLFRLAAAWCLVLGLAAEVRVKGADSEPPPPADPKIRGVFNTELPRTEWRDNLRLTVHPHFGDLTRRDYLRVPLGLRYGLTERWELSGELEGYLAHGLGQARFGRAAGVSGVGLATKYRWGQWLRPWLDTASGVSCSAPVETPPADITDGLRHITPFLTFAHQLETRPGVTAFLAVAYDFATPTAVRGIRRKNDFIDDSWSVTPGFLWNRGPLRYTFEAGLASAAGVGADPATVITLRPAVTWELPRTLTFRSEGRWVLGLGLRAGFGPDGTDLGASAKLRGDFDFRRLLGLRRRER